jgi:ferredoxin-NADP reductase
MSTVATGRPVYRARIERIHDHAEDVRSLFLRTTERPLAAFLPGMFVSIAIELPDDSRVRPYTIVSSPEDGEPFEIVFNRVPGGAGVAWLFEREPGNELCYTGPFGAFTLATIPSDEVVFVAENTAVAPVRPLIRQVLAGPRIPRIELLYAADRADHLLYRDEFEGLARKHRELHFSPIIVAAGESLRALLIEEIQRRWIGGDANRSRQFYICGVGNWVIDLRDRLRASGYERRAIRYEKW